MKTQTTGTIMYPNPDHETLAPDDVTLPTPDEETSPVSNDYTMKLISGSGISEKPTPTHTRTGERRINFWATLPIVLHVATVLTLMSTLLVYIDGNHFHLESRSALPGTFFLQSDITTGISTGVTAYRIFAGMWSGALLWRCIFILLANGGIALEKIDSLLTWQIHIPSRLSSSQVLISIILLAAFPLQPSGPILTGSITWSSSYCLAEGQPATGISGGFPGDLQPTKSGPDGLIPPAAALAVDNTLTSGFASTAWLNSLEDERTMKRVIDSIAHLPINSTLRNVTLPYFAVTKLEWIEDPKKDFPRQVVVPKYFGPGAFALIPNGDWPDTFGASHKSSIISESRVVIGYFKKYRPDSSCTSSHLFGNLPANIGSRVLNDICLIYGRVTYNAGAAECLDCRLSSRVTVQNDTALRVSSSTETQGAVDMMPMVGGMMTMQNNSLPRAYNNLDRYVIELLIRSYAASWTSLRKSSDESTLSVSLSSDVRIAIPTSKAEVLRGRVWLWLFLNLLFTLSGVLFLVVQRSSGQKLVGSPQLAALLLDTSEVLHKKDRAFCDFSTLTKDDKGIGNLCLTRNWDQGGHRQVRFDEE